MTMGVKDLLVAGMVLLMTACTGRNENMQDTVSVKEVIEVEQYTYLLVEQAKKEFWIAVPAMEANPGEKYRYHGGMEMKDFYSRELDRTFESVIFADGLMPVNTNEAEIRGKTPGSQAVQDRSDVEIIHAEGVTPISEIFAQPGAFEGQQLKVSGRVTKFNPAIMERNWIHIQDGTEYEGKYDLVATSTESFEVGDIITLTGVLAVDQDFGYGYTYEVLLENATRISAHSR